MKNGGFEVGATSGKLSQTIPGDLIYVFGVGVATDIGGWTVSLFASRRTLISCQATVLNPVPAPVGAPPVNSLGGKGRRAPKP